MQDVFGVKPKSTEDYIRITSLQTLSHAAPKNVTFLSSSVLDTPAEIIAHTCACDIRHPWGLAKRIIDQFPNAKLPFKDNNGNSRKKIAKI